MKKYIIQHVSIHIMIVSKNQNHFEEGDGQKDGAPIKLSSSMSIDYMYTGP